MVSVVRQPKGSRLVIMHIGSDCSGEALYLGEYQNGMYVFGYTIRIGDLTYDEHKEGFSLREQDGFYSGYYGKDYVRTIKESLGELEFERQSIDWAKVSEKQLEEIFNQAISDGCTRVVVVTAKDKCK